VTFSQDAAGVAFTVPAVGVYEIAIVTLKASSPDPR